MRIAIRLDAGPDASGHERKLTALIDQHGRLHDVLVGWQACDAPGVALGPVYRITPEEWLLQLQVAQGTGL